MTQPLQVEKKSKQEKDDYFKYVKVLRRPVINLTSTLPKPTVYSLALDNEYKDVAFSEERAPANKGLWRLKVFAGVASTPLDVEIGTGAGDHFADWAQKHPERLVVGLELKYKPLIQSIRRTRVAGCKNAAICRYHAFNLDLLFDKGEVNNVFIHFPDPWTSPYKPKNRVVNRIILDWLYEMQRPGSFLEFKTDSREYFLWALEEIKASKYRVEFQTLNLYGEAGGADSRYLQENFATGFEKIFIRQGIEINYIRLVRD